MRVAISYDNEGRILTLFDPDRLHREKSGLRYVPRTDEKHQVFDLPKEFENSPVLDLPSLLRVNASGPKPVLEAVGKTGHK